MPSGCGRGSPPPANLFASGRIQAVLEDRLGCAIENAAVLTNPITFAPREAAESPPAGPPYRFVMLGALKVAWKAQDNVIRALARPEWLARDWVLELYGEGPDEPMLRALVAATGLEARVRLRGHTPDPAAALRGAHLVLQTSRVDAMPLTVMEALAVGRPVVVSRVGEMPAWVHQGENGWVCEDASVERIADALEAAWQRRADWPLMGARSHRLFVDRYPHPPEEAFLAQITAPPAGTSR